MYQGKHFHNKKNRWNKPALIVVSLLLIATMTLGGTLAYIFTGTEDVENTFNPTKVTTAVVEDIATDTSKKQDVKIQNTGSTDAYIRAAVVVTWQDAQGNVYGKQPVANTDYSVTYNTDTQAEPAGKWVKNGDFYYWNASVAPNGTTGELITTCSQLQDCENNDYKLTVEIIGSGIQSKGVKGNTKAVVDAWGVDPENPA